MSKIDLASQGWCDLVFEGRNKEYGAYRNRANKGKFQLRAIIVVLIMIAAIVAFLLAKSAVESALAKNSNSLDDDQVTELQELKKDEPKKEEKKKEPELEYEKPVEKVAVKSSIQFTVPKIVDDDKVDTSKELKTQDEVTKNKFAISSQDYDNGGDPNVGINIDDLKENQQAGGTTIPPKEPEVVDNSIVEVPATFPGGESALLKFVSSNLKYPDIALEQELQGTVVLRFKVDTDGSVSTVKVEKSLSKECDQAAAAVVRKLPRFVPAKQQGHPVPVWFRLPVRFRIN